MQEEKEYQVPEGFKTLISKEEIDNRIRQIAREIDSWFDPDKWVILAVLEGARPFAEELVKHLRSCKKWYPIQVSSYGQGFESTGNVKMVTGLDKGLVKGKNVLVLEDIVDTGRTVAFIRHYIRSKGALSIKVATLLSKPSRREVDVKEDVCIIGFEIKNLFVIGFGLDLYGGYRELPMIGYLENSNEN